MVTSPSVSSGKPFAIFAHPVWRWAFATMILIMLFATIWLATKERRLAQRFIPHHIQPVATTPPTPEVSHHAAHSSEPLSHRDDSPAPPSHEATTSSIVLDSMTAAETAPIVTVATVRDQNLRVQLMLSEHGQSTYVAELMTINGDVVYREAEIATITADADRIDFDIPIEQLAAGDFQIKLTRTSDSKQAIYFLRVR